MARFKNHKYYRFLIIGSLLYLVITLLSPLSDNRYDLSLLQTRLLQLTIVLPVLAIWGMAFFGVTRIHTYAQGIKESLDGAALRRLSNGLLWLVFGLMVSGLVGSLRPWAAVHNLTAQFVLFNSYLAIVFPLIGFWKTYRGSAGLLKLTPTKQTPTGIKLTAGLILAAVVYIYARAAIKANGVSPYNLDDGLLLLTIVLPYGVSWALGIGTAINIGIYQKTVKGFIYRQALKRLTAGLYVIISFSILVQLLTSLANYFEASTLRLILLVIYLLLAIYGLGYLLIANAAKKLIKIETVQ